MGILSGCVKRSCNCLKGSDLPDMPIAGRQVATELESLCKQGSCLYLNNWLNELYFFKQEYLIYKTYEAN